MISRRSVIGSSAVLGFVGAKAAFARPYPSRPIRAIVSTTAGTSVDVTTRFMARALEKSWQTPVIVENRIGAGGVVGVEMVSRSPADGYELLFIGNALFTIPWTAEKPVQFDPLRDFVPIARFNKSALAIAVPANSPYASLADLVGAMKARPGEITFASGGNGSTTHMCAALLNEVTGTQASHVPYRGNTPAITDTAGGQVDFTCNSAMVVPLAKTGKLRVLAVTNRERWASLPDVPTTAQAGFPDFEASSWIGALAPRGTPQAIVRSLSDEFVKAARTPEFKDFCDSQALYVDVRDHQAFAQEFPAEAEKGKRIALLSRKS